MVLVEEVQRVLQNVKMEVEVHLCSLAVVAFHPLKEAVVASHPLKEAVLPLNLGQEEEAVVVVLSWALDQVVVEVVAVPSFDEASFHPFAQEQVEGHRRAGQEVLEEDLHVLRGAAQVLYRSQVQPFQVLSFLEPPPPVGHFHLKLRLA